MTKKWKEEGHFYVNFGYFQDGTKKNSNTKLHDFKISITNRLMSQSPSLKFTFLHSLLCDVINTQLSIPDS